ncbi:MAG: hypothetical protein HYV09_15035 [Deltaproteobacteria bacterium]|nr:hypothetical protein [Deltaproteobacteria bacterium]
MKHVVSSLAVVALALGAFGCTPTPEQTCNKLQELADKEKESSSSGKKPFELSMSKCIKNMNEMKERDPDAYKCAAKIVKKLSNLDTAFLAISVCDKNKPKKSSTDSDDDDDGESKTKKSKKASKSDDE